MSTRRERLERRIERREDWAAKARGRSAAAHQAVRDVADHIPFGQPILVGHHSEKRARRDADRIHRGMGKAVAESEKAAHHEGRAEGLRRHLDRTIFSDDHDAIEQLEAKVARLEAQRDLEKKINKLWKKGGAEALRAEGISPRLIKAAERLMRDCPWLKRPADTTNTSAEIRRCRKRIEQIRDRQARAAAAEASGGVQVEVTGKYARVTFAEKPERKIIEALKEAGYRWSQGSWTGPVAGIGAAGLSLNETLASLGYTTEQGHGLYAKKILRDGEVVFSGSAGEVWDWLRDGGAQ